MLSNYIFWLRK